MLYNNTERLYTPSANDTASPIFRRNEWCFSPWFCTCKATLGWVQPGLMRWLLLWITPMEEDWSLDVLTSSPACYHNTTDDPLFRRVLHHTPCPSPPPHSLPASSPPPHLVLLLTHSELIPIIRAITAQLWIYMETALMTAWNSAAKSHIAARMLWTAAILPWELYILQRSCNENTVSTIRFAVGMLYPVVIFLWECHILQ